MYLSLGTSATNVTDNNSDLFACNGSGEYLFFFKERNRFSRKYRIKFCDDAKISIKGQLQLVGLHRISYHEISKSSWIVYHVYNWSIDCLKK